MNETATEEAFTGAVEYKPFIAIVGRPNVGKSTLYNRLTRSRDAIVDDRPGVTRDRMIGIGRLGDKPCWVVDTGGIEADKEEIHELMRLQVDAALLECDAVIFIVDGRSGATPVDQAIAEQLRRDTGRPVYLAINKVEGLDPDIAVADFYQLGLGQPTAISAKNGDGVRSLLNEILGDLANQEHANDNSGNELPEGAPAISIVGRPNVGKSTLVNTLVGEERVVVYDAPGTTRDSIDVPLTLAGKDYVLVDTAGMRRKAKIDDRVERFSVMKSVRAIERSQLVLLLLDARDGVVEQDSRLISLVMNSGRSLMVLVNKWDGMSEYERSQTKASIDKRLRFLGDVPMLFISAKRDKGLKELPKLIDRCLASAMADLGTGKLNRVLQQAVTKRTPPMVGIRSIKLKFAHQGGVNPPHVVIHGNMVDKLPQTYIRYLASSIESAFGLVGTRIRLSFKISENPYDRKNS